MSKHTALIFGINGQDGSYMSELLLDKGYIVHGTIRRSSVITTQRIENIFSQLHLHYADLLDFVSVFNLISTIRPTEIYNFAAQSHVKISAELENYTIQTNTVGILNILQTVRTLGMAETCKIYHAGTSEQFGNTTDGHILLDESSPQTPVSIYGISKVAANQICNMYRDAYGMFVVCSILFNHESERRGHNFVTQKVAQYIGQYHKASRMDIESNLQRYKYLKPLQIGNLNAKRDWGYAKEFMEAVWLMMQQKVPDNYVIATGETHTVREFIEEAFRFININVEWMGEGINEVGVHAETGEILVQVDKKYFRDLELNVLVGNASKAKSVLGWKAKTTFIDLVGIMVGAGCARPKSCV